MFTHKPMWVVWLMKMGDCEPSYGYGKAHVVSGHWFSPWHTGREPNLSNPFQGLFFLAWFLTWFLTWFLAVFTSPLNGSERFRTENERFRGIPPEKGMKNLRKNSRKNSRNNPCKGFWTVQGFPPYHVKNSRWPVGSGVPMLAKTNLPEKIDGFPFAGFSWYAGWVGL